MRIKHTYIVMRKLQATKPSMAAGGTRRWSEAESYALQVRGVDAPSHAIPDTCVEGINLRSALEIRGALGFLGVGAP